MKKADELARQQHRPAQIDAAPTASPTTDPTRGKQTVTTGKMPVYDPGPPTPPPLSVYENDNGPQGDPLDIGDDDEDINPKNRF